MRSAILALLIITACAGTSDPVSTSVTTSSPAEATTSTGPTTTEASSTAEPTPDELAAFIAAMEELLVGTVYKGAALGEPELFLATGWLLCEGLDAGDDVDTVLARYLEELAGGAEEADDDQLTLAGGLLGAAVAVLCPQHADALGG